MLVTKCVTSHIFLQIYNRFWIYVYLLLHNSILKALCETLLHIICSLQPTAKKNIAYCWGSSFYALNKCDHCNWLWFEFSSGCVTRGWSKYCNKWRKMVVVVVDGDQWSKKRQGEKLIYHYQHISVETILSTQFLTSITRALHYLQ